MSQYENNVRGSVYDAVKHLENEIPNSSLSAKLIEKYDLCSNDGKCCTILIFEKYYMRNSSRISLTISVDNLNQTTHVCATTSGGGEGAFFSFDWGAGKNFISQVAETIDAMR